MSLCLAVAKEAETWNRRSCWEDLVGTRKVDRAAAVGGDMKGAKGHLLGSIVGHDMVENREGRLRMVRTR